MLEKQRQEQERQAQLPMRGTESSSGKEGPVGGVGAGGGRVGGGKVGGERGWEVEEVGRRWEVVGGVGGGRGQVGARREGGGGGGR